MLRTLSTKFQAPFLFAFILTVFVLISCRKTTSWESYGAGITSENALSTAEMIDVSLGTDSVSLKFEGEIEEVCQMKGCWMTLKSDSGERIRVTFRDYGFFVPRDAAGRKVIVEGVAASKQLDEATARHYAEDAGETFDPATGLQEISVVASGVLIEKPAPL